MGCPSARSDRYASGSISGYFGAKFESKEHRIHVARLLIIMNGCGRRRSGKTDRRRSGGGQRSHMTP